jgi:hypothetical protein
MVDCVQKQKVWREKEPDCTKCQSAFNLTMYDNFNDRARWDSRVGRAYDSIS